MTTPNETGLFLGVGRDTYDRIARVNWSWLKHMKKSPMHFRAFGQEKVREDTDAMRLGRATHLAALEPERFRSCYALWDGGRRAGKEWEKFRAQAEADRLEILTEDQYQEALAIAAAATTNEHAARWLRGGSAEVTMLWTHVAPDIEHCPGFSIYCKGRMDIAQGVSALVDLKSCRDASPEAFQRQCWNLGYHEQAAYYQDGYAAVNGGVRVPYVLVAVENHAPYAVQVYQVPDRVLEVGRESYRSLLERLNECRSQNRWPGYAEGPLELELPRWAQAQNDDEDVTGLGLVVNE